MGTKLIREKYDVHNRPLPAVVEDWLLEQIAQFTELLATSKRMHDIHRNEFTDGQLAYARHAVTVLTQVVNDVPEFWRSYRVYHQSRAAGA